MSVSTLRVIGAAVMGSGIAQVSATNGINVLLLDVNGKVVKEGINAVEAREGEANLSPNGGLLLLPRK